ncbi:MAG TPA: rhomboid family intramembrane serine protease [Polyangia bacterium]
MGAEVWILLAASALALQLVTVVMRREHKAELPYLALVLADLGVLVFVTATHREGSLAGKVAASLAAVMVLAPRFLERLERNAFSRDDLGAALRAAKLRELVVPGLGSTRRRRQIANLIEARAGGAASVLRRLDDELAATRGKDELTTLVLERATVLFMAGRYRECIDAARKLGSAWPAEHPVLGVYLVRAHAELGEVADALAVLETVEGGAAGRDPAALGLLTQARLTLLAFAGRQTDVDRLLASDARLLVSERAREFLHVTARDRAAAAAAMPPSLAASLDAVAARAADSARPLVRPRQNARVTVALLVAIVAVHVAMMHGRVLDDPHAATIIRWGALWRPAVHAGEWWRLVTVLFLHEGWLHLLVNAYALFMLGRFCEEVFGPLRFFVTYVAGGLAGAAASTLNTQQGGLSVGASGAIMGILGALIVVLILRRGAWPEAWRRALLWNLVLLGAIQIFIGFQLAVVDNAAHIGGMIGGGAMALVVAPGGLLGRSTAARALLAAVAAVFLAGFVWAGVATARTSLERTIVERIPQKLAHGGERIWRVPQYWERDADKDLLYDPYLVDDGVVLPARQPPADPVLAHLLDRIAKNAPSP